MEHLYCKLHRGGSAYRALVSRVSACTPAHGHQKFNCLRWFRLRERQSHRQLQASTRRKEPCQAGIGTHRAPEEIDTSNVRSKRGAQAVHYLHLRQATFFAPEE